MPDFSEKKVYIFGASGSGTTTLGASVAERTGLVHLDSDDHYWAKGAPPLSHKNEPAERVASMSRAIGPAGWVLSGACHGWAAEIVEQADLIVFVTLQTDARIKRLIARERSRFGHRIDAGGDMHHIHVGFLDWARGYDLPEFSGRNLSAHEEWLAQQTKPIRRLDGQQPIKTSVDLIAATLMAL